MSTPASNHELQELGEVLGITSEQVAIILNQTEARQMVTLAIIRASRIDEARLLQKVIETEATQVAELEDAILDLDHLDLFDLVQQLANEQERIVLHKLYSEALDYHNVADQLRISIEEVIAVEISGITNLANLYYDNGQLTTRT